MRSMFTFLVLLALATGCYNSSENQQVTNSLKTAVPTIENEPKESSAEEVVESEMESESGKPEGNMDESAKPEQDNPDQNPAEPKDSGEVSLADALAQIESGKAVLVDVRRDEEWNEFHFESATHIPLDQINEDAETAFAGISKDQIVFIH